jgi:hypothetical protein
MLQADEELHAVLEEVEAISLKLHGFTSVEPGSKPHRYCPSSKVCEGAEGRNDTRAVSKHSLRFVSKALLGKA